MKGMILWVAQGFGAGRVPVAPGTFGSLVGLLWFGALLPAGDLWVYVAGTVAGIALAIWFCGAAEKILKQTDPASVVLDEIVAVPLCFAGWVGIVFFHEGHLPTPTYFLGPHTWLPTLGIFAAFRFFDVVKPWPVRQSQSWPGGWGVTVDDLLAAVYVNAVVFLVYGVKTLL